MTLEGLDQEFGKSINDGTPLGLAHSDELGRPHLHLLRLRPMSGCAALARGLVRIGAPTVFVALFHLVKAFLWPFSHNGLTSQ
ncbi:hypothetical protein [Haloactinospora alba]|uniref:hypothetical protein n=1 Tax=Haloactinospora alba TaxID=405555 RepID=UPI0014770331|nr:hypothetical protein [Haloactinospora alba]